MRRRGGGATDRGCVVTVSRSCYLGAGRTQDEKKPPPMAGAWVLHDPRVAGVNQPLSAFRRRVMVMATRPSPSRATMPGSGVATIAPKLDVPPALDRLTT